MDVKLFDFDGVVTRVMLGLVLALTSVPQPRNWLSCLFIHIVFVVLLIWCASEVIRCLALVLLASTLLTCDARLTLYNTMIDVF